MTKHVIFDLDNCLSDDAWRIKYIRWDLTIPNDRYEGYHRGCGMDQPYPAHVDFFREMTKDATPIFLTGRPLIVRPPTVYWINKYLQIPNPTLLMRNNDDQRPSVKLKRAMLFDLREHWQIEPVAAYDDRPEIVEMYLENGISAHQLAINDPDLAYVNPTLRPIL